MPKRVDRNQKEITAKFRELNCLVFVTSDVGKGFPDLMVDVNGMLWLVEVKDGEQPPSKQKLTEAEEKFYKIWSQHVIIIKSEEDAVNFVEMVRSKLDLK